MRERWIAVQAESGRRSHRSPKNGRELAYASGSLGVDLLGPILTWLPYLYAPPSDLPPDVDPRKPPVTATASAAPSAVATPGPSEQPAPTQAIPPEPPGDEPSACTLSAPCG